MSCTSAQIPIAIFSTVAVGYPARPRKVAQLSIFAGGDETVSGIEAIFRAACSQ
jgi:hypothetical protein